MNEFMTLAFKKELCNLRKRNMILSGACSALLPADIIEGTEYCRIIYNTLGYRRLSDFRKLDASAVLEITVKILECIDFLKDYLIFPEEYMLTPDFIFVSDDFTKVKIAYLPIQKEGGETAAVAYCIFSLKKTAGANGKKYLEIIGSIIESKNLKMSGIISSIDELKREIKLYGIE